MTNLKPTLLFQLPDLPVDANRFDLNSISRLVVKAKDGDPSAQNEILEQVQDVMLKLARRHFRDDLKGRQNPSDLIQLTLTRMVNGFDGFRGTTENEFMAWLRTIMRNELHVMRRYQQQEKRDARRDCHVDQYEGGPSLAALGVDRNLTPGSEAIKQEKTELLSQAMQNLSSDFAQVIQLRSLDEMPFKEIASRMNRSYEAVAKMWQRAIIQLEAELKKLDVE